MNNVLLHIDQVSFYYQNDSVINNISWSIQQGEAWMLSGESGSGKTTLLKLMAGILKTPAGTISKTVLPSEIYYVSNWYSFTNLEGDRNFYYQQRYNQFAKKDTATVKQELKKWKEEWNLKEAALHALLQLFQFENILERQLFELSSGEHKKLQLIKAFWQQPRLLLIDEPYTGLDIQSRKILNDCLEKYISNGGTCLIVNNENEFPSCIRHFAYLKKGNFSLTNQPLLLADTKPRTQKELPHFLKEYIQDNSSPVVELRNVTITYEDKPLLKNINWRIEAGQQWLLQGANGSGKSTLVSLLNGDHPQAYANDIILFGKKRGSGESIWDIKNKMGIISPELHWYFNLNTNVAQTVASGFFDSMSLYQQINYEQKQQLNELLQYFDLHLLKEKPLKTLSVGQQRLALLARTLVKKPILLILDEPCQGMDSYQTNYFNNVIEELGQLNQTLIYIGHFESKLPNGFTHKLVLENGAIKEAKPYHLPLNECI